jgi:allophanate hydrolase subunit 2
VALGNFALRFDTDATVAVCGAEVATSLDGEPFGLWESRRVERGSELRMVFAQGPGFRMYVALAGGVDVPPFFGSRSTYTMGALGGHEGRPLRQGDRLILGEEQADGAPTRRFKESAHPEYSREREIEAAGGAAGHADYLTDADMETFFGRACRSTGTPTGPASGSSRTSSRGRARAAGSPGAIPRTSSTTATRSAR